MIEFLFTWGLWVWLALLFVGLAFVYALIASAIGSWNPRRVMMALFWPAGGKQ